MRAFAHYGECVRPAGAYRHLFAGFDDPRAAYPLSNPQSSLMHEKPLQAVARELIAQVGHDWASALGRRNFDALRGLLTQLHDALWQG